MHRSNERIALWSDVKANVERRIKENKERIERCRDESLLPILHRIAADDEKRLATANEFIGWHRDKLAVAA